MESWSTQFQQESFKFSCAHFLIFPDGSKERLHGHNYQVHVEIHGRLDDCGSVIESAQARPLISELCDWLDEHWILPSEHPELEIQRDHTDGQTRGHTGREMRATL